MKISHDPDVNQPEMGATVSIFHRAGNHDWSPQFLLLKQGAKVEFTEAEAREAVRLLTLQLSRYESGDVARDIERMWGNGSR